MITDDIRRIIAGNAKLPVDATQIAEDDDLYDIGLTSLNTVNLMLALEDELDIEFPDEMLSRETFESISSLQQVIETLQAQA